MVGIILLGMGLPLLGTVLGAALVLFAPGGMRSQAGLCALSAGAMLASSIWSLLLPALELSFASCAVGFALGMGVLSLPDRVSERRGTKPTATGSLMLALVLHNIPEGMAVGAGLAGFLTHTGVDVAGALTLSLGIALQNIPDGAVAALPLAGAGNTRGKAFWMGTATGLVEPLATLAMVFFAPVLTGWLPALMGFAAGAMVCVIVQELIPRMQDAPAGTAAFTLGFLALMTADVLWG